MNGDFKKVVVGRQAAEFAASAKARRGEVVSHILGKGCAKGHKPDHGTRSRGLSRHGSDQGGHESDVDVPITLITSGFRLPGMGSGLCCILGFRVWFRVKRISWVRVQGLTVSWA